MQLGGALLRKAAGILLIIFGVAATGLSIATVSGLITYYREYNLQTPPDYLYIAAVALGVFVTTGGVFCLKRKYWGLCFTSGLLLHVFMTLSIFIFPWIFFLWLYLSPVWILPLIFICLRKSEWAEPEAWPDASGSQYSEDKA
jgi:hypothetical protein